MLPYCDSLTLAHPQTKDKLSGYSIDGGSEPGHNSEISIASDRANETTAARWGLSYPVDVGARLRQARERRALSLRELARIVKLSPSLISQIETGKARPSVGSLYALTSALGLSIDRLFVEPDGQQGPATSASVPDSEATLVVRANTRKAIELESGVRWERMTAASHSDVDFLFVEYAPGGASAATMTRHAGKEFGFVITGTLTVTVNFDDYVLNPGDSVAFPSTTPHRLWNASDVPVQAVWVVVGRHRAPSSEAS